MDVADIPVMIIVVHEEGWRTVRGIDMATRSGGVATQLHSLSTCHPDDAPVWLEEDAATVTKLLAVRLITKGLCDVTESVTLGDRYSGVTVHS